MRSRESAVSKAVLVLGITLTLAAVWFQITFATSAGGLWRDELNTVGVATLPNLGDVWHNLQFDSFPMLWMLVIRTLSFLGMTSDAEWRAFGLFIGFGLLCSVWFTAKALQCRAPVIALCLFSLTPAAITWGDTIRAWGFGVTLAILTIGLIWRLVEKPSSMRFLSAIVVSVVSVQCLYYNCILLFGICMAGVAVASRRRAWKVALQVLTVGFIAAVSMSPYVLIMRNLGDWNLLVKAAYFDMDIFFGKLSLTLSAGGPFAFWAWVVVVILAILLALLCLCRPVVLQCDDSKQSVVLFSLVALLVSSVGYFLFLKFLCYQTQPWYYLDLLALVAVATDAIFAAALCRMQGQIVLMAIVLLWSGFTLPYTDDAVSMRMTNVDLIAVKLHETARASDLIVVNPWYFGITVDHDFHDPIRWMTIPPLEFHRFHRYDLIKEKMILANQELPTEPVIRQMEEVLKSGHRVFLVGNMPFLRPGRTPPKWTAAPHETYGWSEGAYSTIWAMQALYFLQTHAQMASQIAIPDKQIVNPLENASLIVVEGWRGPAQ